MKTSYQVLRSYFKTVALAVLLAGVGFINSSCSKGGSSAAVNPYGVYNGQIGYGSVSGTTMAVGQWGNDIELRLAFGYSGVGIAAQGQMTIANYVCGLNPGVYPVQTSSLGQAAGNTVYGLGLVANGLPIVIDQANVTESYRLTSYGGIRIYGCSMPLNFF